MNDLEISVDFVNKDYELVSYDYNENLKIIEDDLINNIRSQYLYFYNIGFDYLAELNHNFPNNLFYFERLYIEFLNYIDSVFGLRDIEIIKDDKYKLKLYFESIYNLLYVKSYDIIIAPLKGELSKKGIENIYNTDPNTIRNILVNFFLKNLEIDSCSSNYKYQFINYLGIDLFDSNSEVYVRKFIYNLI